MQSEDIAHAHAHHSDDAIPPSSPLSTGFHRHHPHPTPTAEAADPLSGLRRRAAPGPTRDDPALVSGQGVGAGVGAGIVRIDVRNPWSDGEGRRKEGWVVQRDKTVGELKEDLARGEYEGRWEREGMRIVWQGRIVRDEELLGDIVGNGGEPQHIHIFHLVARRIPPNRSRAPSPYRNLSSTAIPPPQLIAPDPEVSGAPGSSTTSTGLVQATGPGLSPTTLALLDTTHYLLFTARHHLAHLLALPPLQWEDMVPPPVVSQVMAKEAVSSVVRTFAQEQESALEGWEGVFEGDDPEELAAVWDKAGARGGVEAEIKGLWESRIGRQWSSGEEGESVAVEVDALVYQLHLPPLGLMSPTQLLHLVLYLRITSLLPHLSLLLERASQSPPPAPAPTPLLRPTPTIDPIPPPTIWSRVRSVRVPMPVLTHMFFSGLKILAMLWMLTQHMAWDDFRLWILGGAAGGWWLGDGMHRLHRERQLRGDAAAQPGIPRPDGQGGADDGIPHNVAAVAPIHAAAAAAAAAGAAGGGLGRPRIQRQRNPWTLLSLIHMDIDARQLHLPLSSTHSALDASDAQRTATDPARAEAIRRRAGRQPARLLTQLLLPVALWVITLVPEFEAIRARAIRRRERAMRVLVGELTANSPETAVGGVGADVDPAEQFEAAAVEGEGGGEGMGMGPSPVPRHVLPQGLGPAASKYYVRVMQQGEGIDWEEEREAQRALGVGDEEADEGDGMRLRML